MKLIRPDQQSEPPTLNLPLGDKDWSVGPLIGFDTETTGVDTASARIVSAALITDIPGQEPNIREWLINPGVPIDLGVTAIHGISTEHAELHGMDAKTGITEIIETLSTVECPVVVTNGAFDFSILYCEAQRYGLDVTPVLGKLKLIDTLVSDRLLDPYRRGRRTLTAAAAAYGIAIRGAHQATGDVLCGLRLARAIGRKFPAYGHADLDALQKTQADAFREWATEFQEYRRADDEPDFKTSSDWPYQAQIPTD
jgi:DNA polymerase III subunit epsilon